MQFFSRRANLFPLVLAVGGISLCVFAVAMVWYYFGPQFTQVGYSPKQPIVYSHRVHARNLGLDCRYCHANVEVSSVASVPPMQTCMNCHSVVAASSLKLAPLRDAWESGARVEWTRVNKLPDYVYFDHSVHLGAGVGCVECHGRIDEMDQVEQMKPLSMGWCLECHRDPTPNLRPRSEITNMTWTNDGSFKPPAVNPPQNCSGCHR